MSSSAAVAVPSGRHRRAAKPAAGGFRPDVQGLRAIAVSIVVVYHLYPSVLPGGYVGVDVFFAISGFLITGHLLRTVEKTGRVGFVEFYGRRARRLMPAAVLVLAVTWIAARIVLPSTSLQATAEQVRASALYFQNWILAHDAVSYLTADDAPSPVQHFWSLSVEEQFYVFWPLLFLLAALAGGLVARRRGASEDDVLARRAPVSRTVMFALAAVVVVVSYAYSIHETQTNPAAAYFITTTRVWELALGGLLALLATRWAAALGRVGLLAWVGLALVIVAAFSINDNSEFPGSIALLPVAGAVLLLGCGSSAGRFGTSWLMATRPMVFVGDISYSLYLWHWPIIVLWKAQSGGDIGILDGPVIVVVSLVVSWLTKVLVEDRVRLAAFFTKHRWRSLSTVVAAVVPVLLVSVFLWNQPPPYKATTAQDASHPGAATLTGAVATPSGVAFVPPVEAADTDVGAYAKGRGGCQAGQTSHNLRPCTFGDTTNPTRTVALVGDSVAGQWFPALNLIAKKRHWKLVTSLHSLCPWTTAMTVTSKGDDYTACHDWGRKLIGELLRDKPDVVITSARPTVGTKADPGAGKQAWKTIGDGAATYWDQLVAAGIPVVPIAESPEMHKDIPVCLASEDDDVSACSTARDKAISRDTPMEVAAAKAGRDVHLVDMNDYICGTSECRSVVGNVLVYRDRHHLTQTYTVTMQPYLDRKLMATGAFG